MGICPCSRDIEGRISIVKENSQQVLATLAEESLTPRQHNPFDISLRTEDCIIRLVEPFKATYRLLSDLRVEGPAKVALAQYLPTKKMCLVKIIPRGVTQSQIMLGKLTHIDHPNVLKTVEVSKDGANWYVISETCAGGQLSDYLQTHTYMSEVEAASTARQLLSALAYCHQLGITHCSLTPRSIHFKQQLTPDSVFVKVSGFENFDMMSKRHYAALADFSAPELMERETVNGSKCDIWSVGVIIYLMLSGDVPFTGVTPGKFRGFSFPPEKWRHISRDAQLLISSMLSKKADQRPSASKCLLHPWIVQHTAVLPLNAKQVTATVAGLYFPSHHNSLKTSIQQFMLDRVLDDRDVGRIAEVFFAIDRDADGELSEDELLSAYEVILSPSDAKQEVAKAFFTKSAESRGITWSDFVRASYREERLMSRENLKSTFKVLDKDHSGSISANEMRMFFRVNGTAGSVDQWKEVMAPVDTSGDGEIDFSEFEQLLTSAS